MLNSLKDIRNYRENKQFKMESNNIINGNCWIVYFDILGFKNQLNDFISQSKACSEVNIEIEAFVECYYKDILRSLEEKRKYHPDKVFYHWFSDTFLFYTFDDSPESLCCIEQSATHFFVDVIWKKMPLRGALSFGMFYADKKNSIFLGPALIDAYDYGEKQSWIGLVIDPKACSKLKEIRLCPPDRGKYVKYDVPIKVKEKNIRSEVVQKNETEQLFSFKMQEFPNVEESIREMKQDAKNRLDKSEYNKIKNIYENTLTFMKDTKN